MKKLSRISAALLAAVLLAGCGSSISSKDGGYYSVNEAASAEAGYDTVAGAGSSAQSRAGMAGSRVARTRRPLGPQASTQRVSASKW